MKEKILISACLMGFPVRYNQSDKPLRSALLERWQQEERLIVHCPELAAGLETPRLPAELTGGQGADALAGGAKIREVDGSDVTPHYLLAAWLALKTAQENHCRFAIMTDGSPTCGSSRIYDGTFQGKTIAGEGVAAALLRQHGIEVFAEHQMAALAQRLVEVESV
ncbi:DUF523 domain-containing protein [Trabulsiella odontotermitis]|uniref:DUF523 domain-containing protein n=1 Tax=Trabulsiella odontotermitis TaxID=379893 RepID=UPI0024B6A102|nr:DUF523 domain-containing protein [Trabulsiella odontotermitis]WHP32282.1 DUF523 domain-containing protein [Trabulsiella odontotermitis]